MRANIPFAVLAAGVGAMLALTGGRLDRIADSAAQTAAELWSFEMIGTGIKPAISVDPDGTAHVAYLREAIPAAAYYATNASGEWVSQTGAKGYFYGPVDIDAGPDGAVYIAYHDHEGESFDPARGSGVVLTVANGAITEAKIDDPGHDQWDADIAAGPDGAWHFAGIDPAQFGRSEGLEYATNAFGGVRVETVGSGPQPYEFGVSIERAPDGRVGITYHDREPEDLVYAERAPGPDGAWNLTTVDAAGRAGRYSDLAYDAAGAPHISYWVFDGATNGRVRYATREADGTWRTEDVGTLANVTDGFAGARKLTAIELDSDGRPQIMYGDRDEILYAGRTGGGWTSTTVVTAGERPLGQLVEFDLDGDDRPHLVYFEVTGTESGVPSLAGEVFYGVAN